MKTPRAPRGGTGLTSYGKNTVESGCVRLEKIYGQNRLGLLTLTYPALPEDYLLLLIADHSEIVRQLLQQIDREITRKSPKSKGHYVGVTEIQEGRMDRTGIPCPHLHIVYPSHGGGAVWDWWIMADRIRAIWHSILSARLARLLPSDQLPEINVKASVDCQKLKKSPAKYLCKYLSKGSCIKKIKESKYADFLPSAWWHCGRALKADIKKHIIKAPITLLTAIREGIDLVARGLCEYLYPVERDGKVFGWSGKLTKLGSKFFRNSS